jgi:hypothetical protein
VVRGLSHLIASTQEKAMSTRSTAIAFGAVTLSIACFICIAEINANHGSDDEYGGGTRNATAVFPDDANSALKTFAAVSQGINDQLVYCTYSDAHARSFWTSASMRCTPIN